MTWSCVWTAVQRVWSDRCRGRCRTTAVTSTSATRCTTRWTTRRSTPRRSSRTPPTRSTCRPSVKCPVRIHTSRPATSTSNQATHRLTACCRGTSRSQNRFDFSTIFDRLLFRVCFRGQRWPEWLATICLHSTLPSVNTAASLTFLRHHFKTWSIHLPPYRSSQTTLTPDQTKRRTSLWSVHTLVKLVPIVFKAKYKNVTQPNPLQPLKFWTQLNPTHGLTQPVSMSANGSVFSAYFHVIYQIPTDAALVFDCCC